MLRKRRYCLGGLCQSNDSTFSGAFVNVGKGNNEQLVTSCGSRDIWIGCTFCIEDCAVFVADKLFTCSFMQCLLASFLQCPSLMLSAIDTLPVCSQTIVSTPEPIQTIISDSRRESVIFTDFLIFCGAKLGIY